MDDLGARNAGRRVQVCAMWVVSIMELYSRCSAYGGSQVVDAQVMQGLRISDQTLIMSARVVLEKDAGEGWSFQLEQGLWKQRNCSDRSPRDLHRHTLPPPT